MQVTKVLLDGVDVGLVANKRLCCLAGADIPQLGGGITSAGHKGVLIWSKGQASRQCQGQMASR